ncbi:MAG TPA: threonine synthase, partial [Actinomycetota bacterium]|nr:threonine synthase [Actinomycetota bacterium]
SLAEEGIFVELASAASVAGLRQLGANDLVPEGSTVVCVLTGHGLKDPDWAIAGAPGTHKADATAEAILAEIDLA